MPDPRIRLVVNAVTSTPESFDVDPEPDSRALVPAPEGNPWAGPSASESVPVSSQLRRRRWRDSLLVVVKLAAIGAVLGVISGFVWLRIAPRPLLEVRGDSIFFLDGEDRLIIGQDGWFMITMLVVGVIIGLVAYLRWRRFGPATVIGAALAAGIAAVIAWRIGVSLGRSDLAGVEGSIADGTRTYGSLRLRAFGALFVAPIAATLSTLAATLTYGTGPEPSVAYGTGPEPSQPMNVPEGALEATTARQPPPSSRDEGAF